VECATDTEELDATSLHRLHLLLSFGHAVACYIMKKQSWWGQIPIYF
jgi:hypothetical protein